MHEHLPTIDIDRSILEFLDRAVSIAAHALRHVIQKLQRVAVGKQRRPSDAAN